MARILVIDDDAISRSFLAAALENRGYEVEQARDGKKAMQLLQTYLPDLVITDLYMPDMDGLEVIKEVTARYPAIKVIGIHGGFKMEGFDILDIAQKVGAYRALQKADGIEALLAAVQEALAT